MPDSYDMVEELIARAILESVHTFEQQKPGVHIRGYALLTTDDVGALYCAILGDDARPTIQTDEPTDWEYEAYESFVAVTQVVEQMGRVAADRDAHAEACFRVFMEAFQRVRREGLLAGVRLYVRSTDMGPKIEALSDRAEKILNRVSIPS